MHVSLNLKGTLASNVVVGRDQNGNPAASFFVRTNIPASNGKTYGGGFDVVVGERLVDQVKNLKEGTPIALSAAVKGSTAFGTGQGILANVDLRAYRVMVVAEGQPDYTEVTIVGRVARDAEMETMADNGHDRTSFTIIHNYSFMRGGKEEERSQYFDVYFTGRSESDKQPTGVAKMAKEGQELIITGSLHAQGYARREDGRKVGRLKVNGFTCDFGGGKPKELTDEEKAQRAADRAARSSRSPGKPAELAHVGREELGF